MVLLGPNGGRAGRVKALARGRQHRATVSQWLSNSNARMVAVIPILDGSIDPE